MKLAPYTKIVRTYSDIRNNTYTVFSNVTGGEIVLDNYSYEFLNMISTNGIIKVPVLLKLKSKPFIKELINSKIIVEDYPEEYPYFSLYHSEIKYPLTHLTLELTNYCNLNCVHCYGKFGMPNTISQMSYDDYLNLKKDFNILNLKGIALTGGECTLNNYFEKIADDILKNGYQLCILTNGFKNDILKKFVLEHKIFSYTIKISLDGEENTHNFIRNNKNSYKNVMDLLDFLYDYSNITVYVSSILMKYNENEYNRFNNYLKNKYPRYIHTTDIIFPSGNALDNYECYSVNELIELKNKYPNLFRASDELSKKTFRCTGGISQCTITPNGYIKICNAADDKRFLFKYNAINHGLKEAWIDCGDNISFFRSELAKSTKSCNSCHNKSRCSTVDCRLLAYFYTGSELNSSPLTCLIEKGQL